MTQEEKAKAYDEAIKRVEDIKTGKCETTFIFTEGLFDYIFPELKESEDEQIRKELTKHLKEGVEGYMPAGDSSDYRRWLDWLEKQGKSSDQIHYWTEEEIEPIISDYLRGAEHYGGMIARLRCLKPKSLEKQCEQKPAIEMKSAEESLGIDSDTYNEIVDECIYGEQKPNYTTLVETGDGGINALVTGELPTNGCDYEQKPITKIPVSDELYEHIRNTCACIDDAINCNSIKDVRDYLAQAKTDANIALDMVRILLINNKPKFKVGDWITNGDYTWKIVEIKPLDYILQSQDGNIVDDTISHVDEQFHSFTIQDAKEGDVLYHENKYNGTEFIVMNKGINECGNIDSYFRYNSSNGFGIDIPSVLSVKCDNITPATKEQRDLLFQKMHEAGYEWDAEKKELKLLITNGGDFF